MTDPALEAVLARWAEFEEPSAWRRSPKGNLWRHWEGATVSIYRRRDGFGWCIADEDGPRYSQRAYETEADAITAAGEALGVGEGG